MISMVSIMSMRAMVTSVDCCWMDVTMMIRGRTTTISTTMTVTVVMVMVMMMMTLTTTILVDGDIVGGGVASDVDVADEDAANDGDDDAGTDDNTMAAPIVTAASRRMPMQMKRMQKKIAATMRSCEW